MVYSSCGDLVGFFTGRMTSVETLAGCAGDGDDHEHHGDLPKGWPVDAALYVRWHTDSFDAHGLGAIEPVGFAATAVPLEEEDDHHHQHRRLAHGHEKSQNRNDCLDFFLSVARLRLGFGPSKG